jgi:(2Fe-2S) ferredoxin
MKPMSRPMTRADWAWLTTCVAFGLFIATLAILSEIGDARQYYGTKYTVLTANGQPVMAKVESTVMPNYTTCITVLTNEDAQKIVQAAHEADPNVETLISANHPRMSGLDYYIILVGSIMGVMLMSYLFRIVKQVFERLLRGAHRTPQPEPTHD